MHAVSLYLALLAVAAVTNGIRRAVPFPLPLLQICAGALLAWPIGLKVELDPEIFLLVFVPPLLFIDGWRIPKQEFRRFRNVILFMAFGLVVFTVVGLGLLIRAVVPSMPLFIDFALAAALSPTDAVAVAGISGRTKVPPALMHILSGEALMNDASGLVCLRVAIAAAATGFFSWSRAAQSLVFVALGGVAIGALIAWLFARLQQFVFRRRDDASDARVLLVVTIPYAAYLAAEHVHASGILAAAAAGMVLPRLGMFEVSDRVGRRHTAIVLDAGEVALNGLVFMLLGLQLPRIVLGAPKVVAAAGWHSWTSLVEAILIVATGLFALRFLWVWVTMRITLYRQRTTATPIQIPLRLVTATALAGVRGAVSLAAALILPATIDTDSGPYPVREISVCVAAGVIVISLVSASVGLPLVLRGVSLPNNSRDMRRERRESLRVELAEVAIAALEDARQAATGRASPEASETALDAAAVVLDYYRARAAGASDEEAIQREFAVRELRLVALGAERQHLHGLWRKHSIDDVLYQEALREIDVTEEAIAKRESTYHGHG